MSRSRSATYLAFIGVVCTGLTLFLCVPSIIHMVTNQKSINVLAWPTELDPEFIADFEKQTGIKVYFSYVETNEEVLAKVRLNNTADYDLIMASDYMIAQMISHDLLQPLVKSKFQYWSTFYPDLLNHYFDPNNQYSIPFFWDIYGLCIDTRYIDIDYAKKEGWNLIFDPIKIIGRIGMVEDHREAVILAATYLLHKSKKTESFSDISAIKEVLYTQKQKVARYTDARAGALVASEASQCAITISTDVIRLQGYHPHIVFVAPAYGTFMILDNFAISRKTMKQDYVYAFLNYIYDARILYRYANKYTLRTACRNIQSDIITDELNPNEVFRLKGTFFKSTLSEDAITQLWVSILS